MAHNPHLVRSSSAYANSVLLKRCIDEKTRKELEETYRVNVSHRDISAGEHHHPRLALERELALQALHSRVEREQLCSEEHPMLDCFGNRRAMERYRYSGLHSCMPQHVASDATRLNAAYGLTRYCTHEPQECECVVPGCLAFVNSLYYISPEDVARLLTKCESRTGFAILHVFEGLAGNFYGKEMEWYRSSSTRVVAQLDSGVTTWEHEDASWTRRQYYVPNIQAVLTTEYFYNVGCTHLIRMTLAPPPRIPRAPRRVEQWSPAMASSATDGLYALPSAFTGKAAEALNLEVQHVMDARIAVFNGLLVVLYQTPREVVLSPAIVATLTSAALGKSRTPELYRSLLDRARNLYSAVPNLPPAKLPHCVLFSVVLALEKCTETETVALLNVLHYQGSLWREHSRLLTFEQPSSFAVSSVVAGVASTTIVGGIEWMWPPEWVTPDPSPVVHVAATALHCKMTALSGAHATMHAVSAVAIATPVGVLSVPLITAVASAASVSYSAYTLYNWYFKPVAHHQSSLVQWEASLPGEMPLTPYDPIHFPYAPRRGGIAGPFGVKPSAPLAPGASLQQAVIQTTKECETKKMELQGIAVQVAPTYYENTPSNTKSAITNRLTRETPIALPNAWDTALSIYKLTDHSKRFSKAMPRRITVNRNSVIAWAKERPYPQRRIDEFAAAFDEWKSGGYKIGRKETRQTIFLKEEKASPVVVDQDGGLSLEAKAPRTIMVSTDTLLAATAPVMSVLRRVSSQMYREGNVLPAVMPSGLSVEMMALWTHDAIGIVLHSEFPDYQSEDLIFIGCDQTCNDAHMQKPQLETFGKYCFANTVINPPSVKNYYLNPSKVEATSRQGFKVKTDPRLCTGKAETSQANGKINEIGSVSVIETGAGSQLCDYVPGKSFKITAAHLKKMRPGLGHRYFLMVAGDDNLVITTRSYLIQQFGSLENVVQRCNDFHRDLGFSAKWFKADFYSAEWCSRQFWPTRVTYEGRGELLVPMLGPKIGRTLIRSGWLLRNNSPVTLKSVMVGLRYDVSFVPILREWVEKHLELLPGPAGPAPKVMEWQHRTTSLHNYGQEALRVLENRYGIGADTLKEILRIVDTVKEVPAAVELPMLALLLRRE